MKKVHIQKHRKVFICSPFRPRGVTARQKAEDLRHNRQLARLACGYAVSRGYMPLAPHLFFPEFLSEDMPEERDEIWVIGNRITEGMKREIAVAEELGIPVSRHIPCMPMEGHMLDEFFGWRTPHQDPGYEEDVWNPDEDDEEEGLIYDGD